MALWPIVDRELRVRSRQGVTYWTRCAVGIATAGIALYSVAFAAKSAGGPSAGAAGFAALAWLGFFLSCAACLTTADSISSERREGTLGLLFLTDLHAYEIILGKLTASGLTAFYTITGFIPALALATLSGGVSAGEALRSAAALLNMTVLALAVGLWASTRSHTQSGGRWLALIMVALLIVLPRLGAPLMAQALSPYSAFHLADDLRYNPNRWQFWLSIAFVQCEAWLFLFEAAANIRRNWRVAERVTAPRDDKLRQLAFGRPSVQAERRALLAQAPIRWVASRTQGRRAWIWGGAFLLLLSETGLPLRPLIFGPGWSAALIAGNLVSNLAWAALFAAVAGRLFFDAKRNDGLELLLSTPQGARDIIDGHWWALWGQLRGPLLLVVFLGLLQTVFIGGSGEAIFHRTFMVANRVMDVIAVCWVGLWFGLWARKFSDIITWTVGLVVGLPLAVGALLSILGVFNPFFVGLLGWPVLNLMKDIILIRWAAGNLQRRLRTTAPLAVGEWFE